MAAQTAGGAGGGWWVGRDEDDDAVGAARAGETAGGEGAGVGPLLAGAVGSCDMLSLRGFCCAGWVGRAVDEGPGAFEDDGR